MKIEILKENENKLLHRNEIEYLIKDISVTPSRKELIKKIAALKGTKEENIVIENIIQEFGKKEARAIVRIYENEDFLKRIELEHIIKRHKKEEQKKEEEKTAEKESGAKKEESKQK